MVLPEPAYSLASALRVVMMPEKGGRQAGVADLVAGGAYLGATGIELTAGGFDLGLGVLELAAGLLEFAQAHTVALVEAGGALVGGAGGDELGLGTL